MDSFNINISPETQEIVIIQGEPINISINEDVIQINQKKENYNLNFEGEVVKIDANYPQALEAARIATEKAEEATQIVEGFDEHAQEKIAEYNSNASDKIVEYNQNATEKTSTFNSNTTSKTTAYNNNASAKLSAYNENATEKTNEFNLNAQNKTSDFNSNATQKTLDFNSNATDKTTDFNNNYIAKKEIIDEKAEEASGYADTAKQWAVGEPTEPTGGSAKHWAQEAESSLSGLSSRVRDIEDLIPNTASPSNQLTDENFVNSSIATNTANFIGTFANVTALNAYSGTVTNNDYAFVTNSVVTDNGNDWATFNDLNAYNKSLLTDFDYAWVINGANFDLYRFDIVNQVWVQRATNIQKSSVTLNSAFNRYKATVNGSTTWNYEYTLNNSSFTAAQWAAINSSITSEKVALITPFTGADGTNAGTTGLVTAPSATDNGKFLKGDGTWDLPTAQAAFANITGQPTDNTNLANALNAKQDVATALNYDNISNCITKIPQDIKYEINNGHLIINASSKVYFPNGSGTFDSFTLPSNFDSGDVSGITNDYMFFINSAKAGIVGTSVSNCYSGETEPVNPRTGTIWYDTTNNSVKRWSGSAWVGGFSLPFVTLSAGAVLKQVFNGFGYIGSTVFALPNVKGLSPNYRNEDGSLKNTEVQLTKVCTYTRNDTATLNLSIMPDNIYGTRAEYSPEENVNKFTDGTPTLNRVLCGSISWTSGKITSLTPKTAFHAVDYNDSSIISGWSMPSSGYENLTVGASGTAYTASANGWFAVSALSSSASRAFAIFEKSNGFRSGDHTYSASTAIRVSAPCKKGESIILSYDNCTISNFQFVYAEGEI